MPFRKKSREAGFRTLLLSLTFSMLASVVVIFGFLFVKIYALNNDMGERIKQYIVLNSISEDIQTSRERFSESFWATLEDDLDRAHSMAQESLVFRNRAALKAMNLRSDYSESHSMYFLHRSIINALEFLNRNAPMLDNILLEMPEQERYRLYYQYLKIYDYLLQYTNYMYLSAAVHSDADALDSNLDKVRSLKFFAASALLVVSACAAALSVFITKMISGHVMRMVRSADRISGGDYSADDLPISGPREFRILSDRLNSMKRSLLQRSILEGELHRQEVEKEKILGELERAKFLSLQAQIDPHFLFNTLNAISNMALFENAEKTMELTNNLAGIFRYRLEFKDSVLLSDEFRFVSQYLSIQKARFADRLDYEILLDDSVSSVRVPPLSVQPFVENSVKHGVERKESGGKVVVSARRSGAKALISIEDDGVGLPDGFSLSFLDPGEQSHIGITNVVNRLSIFFGGRLSVDIGNLPGGSGVKVSMLIDLEEES